MSNGCQWLVLKSWDCHISVHLLLILITYNYILIEKEEVLSQVLCQIIHCNLNLIVPHVLILSYITFYLMHYFDILISNLSALGRTWSSKFFNTIRHIRFDHFTSFHLLHQYICTIITKSVDRLYQRWIEVGNDLLWRAHTNLRVKI